MLKQAKSLIGRQQVFLSVFTFAMVISSVSEAGGFKYYGNWGGPGYGGGRPIDSLDRAYRRHDQRYAAEKHWVYTGKADAQLIEESLVASVNPFNSTKPHGRVLGPVSAGAFAVKPSFYKTRVLGQRIPIPSVGATSVGLHQTERVIGVTKSAGSAVGNAGKKVGSHVGKAINKIF
jgi:hypothetical protein